MNEQVAKIGEDGRVLIPVAYRRELHFGAGDSVMLSIEGDRLQIYSVKTLAAEAQKIVQKKAQGKVLTTILKEERQQDLSHE